jgi:hypothetical protein
MIGSFEKHTPTEVLLDLIQRHGGDLDDYFAKVSFGQVSYVCSYGYD